ncbi:MULTISPECIES: sensor histidine kinase [unclassified Erysipelothrix]|nr:sensor histidine kinase [Erysipelothrix sp. strain 2 (EsS2-6-Brazil)]MBK2402818.1 HAMP domain-containing histidine kinase [Erysipelothrix sp. strain 2 (EsS2-6-Brazil)]NBA01688.1 sensor histidine kinase [Erysipelothrix rhusiopathiae]
MKTRDFLMDKAYLMILVGILEGVVSFFLLAVGIQHEIVWIIMFLFALVLLVVLGVEFSRRKRFYDELLMNLEGLDQKYLITEMIPDGEFLDARLWVEVVEDLSKSMADRVNEYKRRQEDYKEYIELWIHEVKTPLAGAKLIASNNSNSEMDLIIREMNHVEDYLEQVLFYARSSSLEKDYMIQPLNLNTHIRNVVKELAPIFIQRKIQIEIQVTEEHVYSDSKWVEFMIKQVLSNALKYVDEGCGHIFVSTTIQEHAITLQICDNGPGIPTQDLERVFERGFTGARGRQNKQATGMGLYLVKMLSNKLNLDVTIESHEGTCVNFVFPKSKMMFK